MELVALIALVALGLQEWRSKRQEAQYAQERRDWAAERVSLLNRIQAPEIARYESQEEPSEEPLYVPFDDDGAHDDYIERRLAGEVV